VAKATIAATVPMPLTNMYGSDKFIRPLQQFCCMVKRFLETTRDYWTLQEITGNYGEITAIGRSQIMTLAFSLSKVNACDCSIIPSLTHTHI